MRKFTIYRLLLMWDDKQSRLCNSRYDMACICMQQKMRIMAMYHIEL